MSFSYSAASVEDNYELIPSNGSNNSTANLVSKKRFNTTHQQKQHGYGTNEILSTSHGLKRTQRRPQYNADRVKSVIESIHKQKQEYIDQNTTAISVPEGFASMEENGSMGDFVPLDPPISVGQDRLNSEAAPASEQIMNNNTSNDLSQNFMTESQYRQYYRDLMGTEPKDKNPASIINNNNQNASLQNSQPMMFQTDPNVVLTKLNYLINLVEEQQAIKTDTVVEDVVLYMFLGVFMIFIVDGFVRVGKYVR